MFWISIALFTVFMTGVWAFFLIAKIHAYKFRDYSPPIVPVTKILSGILLFLTLAGYVLIWRGTSDAPKQDTVTIQESVEADISY